MHGRRDGHQGRSGRDVSNCVRVDGGGDGGGGDGGGGGGGGGGSGGGAQVPFRAAAPAEKFQMSERESSS